MELVLLPLQVLKEAANAREIVVAFHQPAALLGGELVIGNVQGNTTGARRAPHFVVGHPIARLRPGLDGAFGQRLILVRNHQVEIKIDCVPESLAARAGSVRIVERKQTRLRVLINNPAALALEALIEDPAFGQCGQVG